MSIWRRALDDKSAELKTEIDRLSEKLGVRPMQVGLQTNDGLNIYIADDGSYHFTFMSEENSASTVRAASTTFCTGTAKTLSKVRQPNG